MTPTLAEQAASLLLALLAGVALTWWSLTGPRLHRALQLYLARGLRYTLASAWREAGRLFGALRRYAKTGDVIARHRKLRGRE